MATVGTVPVQNVVLPPRHNDVIEQREPEWSKTVPRRFDIRELPVALRDGLMHTAHPSETAVKHGGGEEPTSI